MPDWKKADPELVREVVREAELFIQRQVTLATSADQRAAMLGGIFTAAATALIVGVIAVVTNGIAAPGIVWGGVVAALLFVIAAGLCISTVLPVEFGLPGNEPQNWYEDIESERGLSELLGEEAEREQGKIGDNNAVLIANARRFKWGAIARISAPLVGLVVWFLLSIEFKPLA